MSKWNEMINRYNPNYTDLSDLLDEAENVGRANAIEDILSIANECLSVEALIEVLERMI